MILFLWHVVNHTSAIPVKTIFDADNDDKVGIMTAPESTPTPIRVFGLAVFSLRRKDAFSLFFSKLQPKWIQQNLFKNIIDKLKSQKHAIYKRN